MADLSYLKFWGRDRPVFLQPVAKETELFYPMRYQRGLERIRFALQFGTGLMTVAMPAGHGASTLARMLFHELSVTTHEVGLLAFFQKQDKPGWLMPKLASQFGFGPTVDDLLRFYDEVKEERRVLALLIDDAKRLAHRDAAEDLTGLFSLASNALLPVGVVLIGFDGGQGVLQGSHLASAHQGHVSLGSYDADETRLYVQHRLQLASLDPEMVTVPFAEALTQASGGVIGRINRIMENGLMLAAEANVKMLTPALIEVWEQEQGAAQGVAAAQVSEPAAKIVEPAVAPLPIETKKESGERDKPIDLRSLFLDETGS